MRRAGDFQSNGFENRKIFEPRSLYRHQGLNLAALPFGQHRRKFPYAVILNMRCGEKTGRFSV